MFARRGNRRYFEPACRNGRRRGSGAPLGTVELEEADLRQFREQRRALADAEVCASMLRYSYGALCDALRSKYGLPQRFEVDLEAGTAKAVAN